MVNAGKTYTLTGPEVLTVYDKVRIISEVIGKDIQFIELTEDQARERMREQGAPEEPSISSWDGMPTLPNPRTQWIRPSSRSLVVQHAPSLSGSQNMCNILKRRETSDLIRNRSNGVGRHVVDQRHKVRAA